jgi:hypothetical protein
MTDMQVKLLHASIVMMLVGTLSTPASAQEQTVVWTNLVNATATNGILQKTGGCDGCDDAGGTSQQEIASGDGYVQFSIGETNTFYLAGLSHGNPGTSFGEIDYAFRFNGAGAADIWENGVYQAGGDTPYAVGDVFRIAVSGGRVQYSRNGKLIHQSGVPPQHPLLLDAALGTLGTTVRNAKIATTAAPPASANGGFLEKAGSPALRPRFTGAQINAFLPPAGRGPFRFPAPYNTTGVRLTNASDCPTGEDCLWYFGYSYWRNTNYHVGQNTMLIFVSFDRNRGGVGPSLLSYDKNTDAVVNRGAIFDPASPYSYSTGEGWYFSGKLPTKLYTFLVGGTQLRRYDVITKQFDATPALDLQRCPRPRVCSSNASFIIQPHSSDDDKVHSATVQDAAFNRLGCVVRTPSKYFYFARSTGSVFDECHVDKSGRWVLLLETRSTGANDNRLVDLKTGRIVRIDDVNGALGHLDMGFGYAVGADNYSPMPNATVLLKFPITSSGLPGRVVHFNKRWDIAAANHVAHGNAAGSLPPDAQYACGSNGSRVADMADEIVCFPLDPNRNADGSLDVLVVAQVMTDLNAAGGGGVDVDGDDYEQLPKGNIDVTGRYFVWTSNMGGDRLDAFLVKIPSELLAATAQTTTTTGTRRN